MPTPQLSAPRSRSPHQCLDKLTNSMMHLGSRRTWPAVQVATGKIWQSSKHSKHDTTILQQHTIRTNTSHVFHFINVKSLRLIQESLNSWSWSRPLCVWTPHLMSAVTGRKWNNQNRHRCEGHWLKSTGWDVRTVQAKRWLLDGLCDRLFPWSFPTSSKKWYWKNLTTISNIQRRKMLSIDRRESIEADTDPCRSSSSHRRFDSLLEARAATQMKCHLATNLKCVEISWACRATFTSAPRGSPPYKYPMQMQVLQLTQGFLWRYPKDPKVSVMYRKGLAAIRNLSISGLCPSAVHPMTEMPWSLLSMSKGIKA